MPQGCLSQPGLDLKKNKKSPYHSSLRRRKKAQNILTLFPQHLGQTECRRFFKFTPRSYLQTARWLIHFALNYECCSFVSLNFKRNRVDLWTTVRVVTFSLHLLLHSLILPTGTIAVLCYFLHHSSLLSFFWSRRFVGTIKKDCKGPPVLPFCTCGGKWISRWLFGRLRGSRCPVCPPAAKAPMKKHEKKDNYVMKAGKDH